MFNYTNIINATQNMNDYDKLTYIAHSAFLGPVIAILVFWIILTLIVAFATGVRKGRDKIMIIFFISFLFTLFLFALTFIWPIIPDYWSNLTTWFK